MAKGYRLIEPIEVSPLPGYKIYQEYAVIVLHWLAQELYKELGEKLAKVEVEIIQVVHYFGAYPALGLHYEPYDLELEQLVEDTCNRLIRERPISELIKFIVESQLDWKLETAKLMKQNNARPQDNSEPTNAP